MAAQLTFASEALDEKPRDVPGTLKITGSDLEKPVYLSTTSRYVYAWALAYNLLRDASPDLAQQYAQRAYDAIMAMPRRNTQISGYGGNARLNLAVYIPNYVYAADLLGEWPLPSTGVQFARSDDARLLKTWLGSTVIRYPYNAAYTRVNNWGAWGRLASAVIADYVGDAAPLYVQRFVATEAGEFVLDPDVPCDPGTVESCVREAADTVYANALQLHFDVVDGRLWEFTLRSCDASGSKSMIRPDGGMPDELRRQYDCDTTRLRDPDGSAARYTQFALEAMVCLAELAWRRGDPSVYTHQDPATGRGALFRAILFLVDNKAKLTRGSMAEMANRFYTYQLSVEQDEAKRRDYRELVSADLPAILKSQNDWPVGTGVVGFGTLTHGFDADDPPPVVPPR
jgi:hypothetical protein